MCEKEGEMEKRQGLKVLKIDELKYRGSTIESKKVKREHTGWSRWTLWGFITKRELNM